MLFFLFYHSCSGREFFYYLTMTLFRFLIKPSSEPMTYRRIDTGGPLNFLNEAAKTNSREKSVPVMALVAYHRPSSEEELETLIEQHSKSHQCECNVRSRGTVADFGKNLYEAQSTCLAYKEKFPSQRIFSMEECYSFMRNLFCVAPLRGLRQEEKSVREIHDLLKAMDGDMSIRLATRSEDFDYAVDYIVSMRGQELGIQVKPESFFNKKECVQNNKEKHARYHRPVLFHIYSNRTMEFLPETTRAIIDFFSSSS